MKCQNCGEREATKKWIGHGSVMDFIHGNYQMWCEICCLEAQIEHNDKLYQELPKKLEEWRKRLRVLYNIEMFEK